MYMPTEPSKMHIAAGILCSIYIEINFLGVFCPRAFEETSWQVWVVSRLTSLRHLHLDHRVRALEVLEVAPHRGRGRRQKLSG